MWLYYENDFTYLLSNKNTLYAEADKGLGHLRVKSFWLASFKGEKTIVPMSSVWKVGASDQQMI